MVQRYTMPDHGEASPFEVTAEPDEEIRLAGGMETTRPVLGYAEVERLHESGRDVRAYAYLARAPGKFGPGSGPLVALPAEKRMKWWGQGYRPVDYTPPVPRKPQRWLPSMVSDAIAAGEPIPDKLAPPGYAGPVFRQEPYYVDAPAGTTEGPPIIQIEPDDVVQNSNSYVCEECGKAFGHHLALAGHRGTHKAR